MSWQVFKQNILNVVNNPTSINDVNVVANLYATEYDSAVKRGNDTINLISVKRGNVDAMRSLLQIALLKGQITDSAGFSLVTDFGNAVIAYWTGAQLNEYPIPVIPAPGSVQNISVNTNLVLNPGTWPGAPSIPPTQNTVPFVDLFISIATSHLTTISGIVNGNSLYPSAPTPTPGPSIINWVGYNIPPSRPGGGVDFKIPEQVLEIHKEELREVIAINEEYPNETADEYIGLLTTQIESGYYTSAPIPEDVDEEVVFTEKQIEDDPYAATCGELIIQYALEDIAILETGTNAGAPKNYGGKRANALGPAGELPPNLSGVIEEMFKIGKTTLDNLKRFQSVGDGYWWCAAATSSWWVKAGFPVPPGSAGCGSWTTWGKKNGWWLGPEETPAAGAAILYYGKERPLGEHIGIVEFIDETGRIHTIEGNASGGGFTRNGVGVFRKIANPSRILGFVNPPCELQTIE